mmetsp:Transcript_6016/g.14352  ORF Transcript_6016/g.14352 Transcript_6016/m.14352 type:complete len:219 (+) Transcript_6016:485-1141(+)
MPVLHGLELAFGVVHFLLHLSRLPDVNNGLTPALDTLRHEAGVCGTVHAFHHCLGILFLSSHVLAELLLRPLHLVLELLLFLVVLAELQPRGPCDAQQPSILVCTHPSHDLLGVLGLGGLELHKLGLQFGQLLFGAPVSLALLYLRTPRLQAEQQQALVSLPGIAHEHTLDSLQLLLLVVKQSLLQILYLLLKLCPEFFFAAGGEHHAQPGAESGVQQ